MPRQVPFTEYEAALLLDAYLKTLSGEKERMESVRDCSLQLRQMALNAGSEIDDIYRNVNGISFQMASMESAYQGHTIMKPATRLFTEIVFLYRNDAARYRQLLKEAKGMASAKIDNEAVFMAWLAQNASGVQLSELYLAFKEIEQQAKKVKIIRTSLYESLDPSTIKKVKAGVESSKIFKFTHKHQWGRITSALNYLLQFASQKTTETKTQETARVEMVESVKELEIVPSPDISSNALLKENIKSTKVTHIETEQDMDQSGAATTVNFHRINSMAFSKPVSLSYFGEVKPESSWKGLYVDACKSLLDDYPDIFTRLKAESLHGSGKTWLVDAENLHLLAVPKQLEEGLFVETNRNASDLVKNLKWLLDECSVDYENVVITYTNKDGKKEASVPAPVTTSAFQKKQYYSELVTLAEEIGDNGQYINVLRSKFDADAANWVWNVETAQQKIREVILEYRIIAESNKVIPKNVSFSSTIREWCDKCGLIRISYAAAKNYLGDVAPFLELLHTIKKAGTILDSQKQKFLDRLVAHADEFNAFYSNQVELFKKVCAYYLDGFSEEEVRALYQTIPAGTFTNDKTEYTVI